MQHVLFACGHLLLDRSLPNDADWKSEVICSMCRADFEAHIRLTHRPKEAYDIMMRSVDDPWDYLDLYVHYEWLGFQKGRAK